MTLFPTVGDILVKIPKKMAILKSFLCLCNTRTGSLVSGCYTLTISLVCLVYYLFRYVGHKLVEDSAEYKGIIYVGFVLYGFMIVSSLVIIPGVQLDKRYLLLPWIYIIILMVLYDTGSVALLTTVHMEREKTLHVWEIIWVFFYLFRLAANCYCFTCVVSQYQELSDGRGTYDYLYKPRRRTRLRNGSQFDLETYDLPFGVHLPPYREEDHTENNPPAYETIYPQAETSIPTDNGESEYAEIEINQTASNLTEYVSHIGNHSYPLPVDENDYHGTLEILDQLTDTRHINSSPNDVLQSSSITHNSNSFDNHQGNSGCCHSDVIYHYPYCPRHSQHLHHHHHHLHDVYDHHHYNHHQNTTSDHQRFEHVTNDRSCKRNRNSQSYEVTVNIEWI